MRNDGRVDAAADPDVDLDLDLPVRDALLLETVPGGVDLLVEELRERVGGAARVRARGVDSVLLDWSGPLRPLLPVRLFSRAAVPLGVVPDGADVPPSTLSALHDSVRHGLLAAVRPAGPPRFRVGPIGPARWVLREALRAGCGWRNDPGGWDVNIEARDGRLVAEVGPLFLTRRAGELLRSPASTTPVVGALMCRLAKLRAGQAVLDPCCGSGTLLVLAGGTAALGRLVGTDVDPAALRRAAENLRRRGVAGTLAMADAGRLPLPAGSVDRVLANLPFGKRVGSHDGNVALYPRALREVSRVLTADGRAVLLTEDKRVFRDAAQRAPRLKIVRELLVETGGLHPTVFVLAPSRRR